MFGIRNDAIDIGILRDRLDRLKPGKQHHDHDFLPNRIGFFGFAEQIV